MNTDRRKTKYLFSIRSASTIAGLIVFTGYLMIILSVAVGTLLFQFETSGTSVDAILNTIAPAIQETGIKPGENTNTAVLSNTTKTSIITQSIKLNLSRSIASLGWADLWKVIVASLLMLWSGYLLRILSILAETQLIDYQSAD